GEPGFARTYLLSEQITRNTPPTAPALTFPKDNDVVTGPIDFTWNTSTDADGDIVTYRHCVWATSDLPTFSQCDISPIKAAALSARFKWIVLVVLIVGLVLVLWLFRSTLLQKRGLLAVIVLAVFAALIVAIYLIKMGAKSVTKSVPELQAGKAYNWKV